MIDMLAAELDALEAGVAVGRTFPDRLAPDSRRALSRAAVVSIPLTPAGLAAAAEVPEDRIVAMAQDWRRLALAYAEADGRLWSVYGLLRPWLTAPARLPEEDRRTACCAAGDFLHRLVQEDQEHTLDRPWIACLLEARALYLAADALDQARAVTDWISDAFLNPGLYAEIERLNRELLDREEHPQPLRWVGRAHQDRADYAAARACYERALPLCRQIGDRAGEAAAWHDLASIDFNQGDYPAARDKSGHSLEIKQQIGDRAGEAVTRHQIATIDLNQGDDTAARDGFGRALEIFQQIGDRAGESATWHQLATINLNQGDDTAARDKFGRSLEIEQQIGNRAGEAATWNALGFIAWKTGRRIEGLRLVALSFLLFGQIGHADAQQAWENLARMAAKLNLPENQIQSLLAEIAASYRADRGQALLRAAFPEVES